MKKIVLLFLLIYNLGNCQIPESQYYRLIPNNTNYTAKGDGTIKYALSTHKITARINGVTQNLATESYIGSAIDGDKVDIAVTGSGTVFTIKNDAVTFSKFQNATSRSFIGRLSASVGDFQELTQAQATGLLLTFTSSTQGVVPASGGGSDDFLLDDGTFSHTIPLIVTNAISAAGGFNLDVVGGDVNLNTDNNFLFGGAQTGMYGADNLFFNTSSTERFKITNTGEWLLASDAGTAGFSLTSNGAGGPPTWQDATAGITADNGLTKTGSNFQLGGLLLGTTNITGAGSDDNLNLGTSGGGELNQFNVKAGSVNMAGSFIANSSGASFIVGNANFGWAGTSEGNISLIATGASGGSAIFGHTLRGYLDFGASSSNQIILTDEGATKEGIEYAADYSATYSNRSLVDRGFVTNNTWGLGGTITLTSAEIVNYHSTTAGNIGFNVTPVSNFDVSGSVGIGSIATLSANTTLNFTHNVVLVDATSGNITITLPSVSGVTRREYLIKKIDAGVNTVTVDANSTQLIDGALTQVLALQWQFIRIKSNGSAWYITAQ